MSFEPVEGEPDDYSDAVESTTPDAEPNVPGPVLRKRPIPDQLDHFSTKLAGLLDRELDRDMLLGIGVAVVNLGVIAAQLRKQEARRVSAEGEHVSNERVEQLFNLADEIMRAPTRFEKSFVISSLGQAVAELAGALERARIRPLSSVTDGIDDAEAEDGQPLHPDDAAVAELRAWIPEGTPDHALIELEAHTLRGVLAVLDGWRSNTFAVAAQRNAVEAELADLLAQIGAPETVWGHQVHGDDGWIGDAVPQGSEAAARRAVHFMNSRIGPEKGARAKLVVHEVWHAETEWMVVEDAA